jgi:methylglutaconyl-CoA hydratase
MLSTIESAIKLSELGTDHPLRIEPAVSRKVGKTAIEMTLVPRMEKNTDWAQGKGFYAKVVENQAELDIDDAHFTAKLAYNWKP